MPPKKKGQRNVITEDKKRELVIKEDMEEYGKIDKMLGDGRFSVILCTGESMVSILAKRFRRKAKKGFVQQFFKKEAITKIETDGRWLRDILTSSSVGFAWNLLRIPFDNIRPVCTAL